MSESREYTLWRKEKGIEPWVKAGVLTDDLKTIRTDIRGKKRRTEIAGQYGYAFDKENVATMFYATVDYYSNVGLVFRNVDSGEYKRMPICSRWNTKRDDWYKKRYWDIHESVKDETKVTMLAIGYDQRRMYDLMLDQSGWTGDFYGYLMARIGTDISAFLKRLRSFYKRKGWEWNYRGYAIEPYRESGLPHIHFYFKGGWIAGIDDIVRLWGWSRPQGIRITVRTGNQVAGYLSSYLKKAVTCVDGNKVHLLYAYFFGVPLYRVAYGKRKKGDDKCEVVEIGEKNIPITEPFVKGHWECVGTDSITDGEWDRKFKPFGKKERINVEEFEKRVRADP